MATSSSRYQRGALEKRSTADGPCWYLRFRQDGGDGVTSRPRIRLGLVKDFPTKKIALMASEDLRKSFNRGEQHDQPVRLFGEVIQRYLREEMPDRYSTAKSYRNRLVNHIEPKWGTVPVLKVRAADVRAWLLSLELSPKTVGLIRDMMRILFRFAMLWEWLPQSINPVSLFRLQEATKRTRMPQVLSIAQFLALVDQIKVEPHRTMVVLTACLGLRCSEMVGLQWRDFDWVAGTLQLRRSVVDNRVGKVKTEHSSKPLPLHPDVALLLQAHRRRSEYTEPTDWVFASPDASGETPYLPHRIQQRYITPAARKIGLGPGAGWHMLRHSYRAWLQNSGAPIGVQRDLLRHADVATTMNVYGGSFVDALREANDSVVKQVIQ